MRNLILTFLVFISLFIGACAPKNNQVEVEPTVEPTAAEVVNIELGFELGE